MSVEYEQTTWESGTTPLSADNMNRIEQGVADCAEAVNGLSASTSDEFDSTATYASGDYCIYKNTLYKFTAAKSAGEWDSSVVEATTVLGEISELNGKLYR